MTEASSRVTSHSGVSTPDATQKSLAAPVIAMASAAGHQLFGLGPATRAASQKDALERARLTVRGRMIRPKTERGVSHE